MASEPTSAPLSYSFGSTPTSAGGDARGTPSSGGGTSPSPRANLGRDAKAALLRLSPATIPGARPYSHAHHQSATHRHFRKLSQVAWRGGSTGDVLQLQRLGDNRHRRTDEETTRMSEGDSYEPTEGRHSPHTVAAIPTRSARSGDSHSRIASSTYHRRPTISIDTVSAELCEPIRASFSPLPEVQSTASNGSRTEQTASEESRSAPAVDDLPETRSATMHSVASSFSVSVSANDPPHSSYPIATIPSHLCDESGSILTHIPPEFSHSPMAFPSASVELSPLTSPSSVALPTRRDSLHVPGFSVSESGFNLLSPSNLSSGWEPPDADGDVPSDAAIADDSAAAAALSPVSQQKKKNARWKFWKKQPGKEPKGKEKNATTTTMAEEKPPTAAQSRMSATASASAVAAPPLLQRTTTLPTAMPSMIPPTAAIAVPAGKKAHTLPATAHVPDESRALHQLSVSVPVTSMVPLASPPKLLTPKNRSSPKGASAGREGVHKRQKSAAGDDVHSPRSSPPAIKPTASSSAGTSPVPQTRPIPAPVSVSMTPTLAPSPSPTRERSGSDSARETRPAAIPFNRSGSVTARGPDRSHAPMDVDSEANNILASLIAAGLIDNPDSPQSPPTPDGPVNSYVDSVYEEADSPMRPIAPRPVTLMSSWTRTTCVPHIPPPPQSALPLPPSKPTSPQPVTNGTLVTTPPRPPAAGPSRTSSMIIYSAPSTGSSAASSSPTTPHISPKLLPMQSPSSPPVSELRQLISGHSTGYLYFLRHLQREYASESLLFWKAAEDFLPLAARAMQGDTERREGDAGIAGFSLVYLALYDMYIKPGAKYEINISSSLRDLLKKDASAHELQRASLLQSVNSSDAHVQRNSEALNQASMINLARIDHTKDDELDGATLVDNPIAGDKYHSASSKRAPPIAVGLAGIDLEEMKTDGGERHVQPHTTTGGASKTAAASSPPAPLVGSALALSTYTHLLQSQTEIEKLLTQDCLPRFKHSTLYEKWRNMAPIKDRTSIGHEHTTRGSMTMPSPPPPPISDVLGPSALSTSAPAVEKRLSCLLPTSAANSFTNNAISNAAAAANAVPPAPPLHDRRPTSVADTSLSSARTGLAGSATAPNSKRGSLIAIGAGAGFIGGLGAGVSGSVATTNRSLTVGASVFAQAAAAASLHAAERARAATTTTK